MRPPLWLGRAAGTRVSQPRSWGSLGPREASPRSWVPLRGQRKAEVEKPGARLEGDLWLKRTLDLLPKSQGPSAAGPPASSKVSGAIVNSLRDARTDCVFSFALLCPHF